MSDEPETPLPKVWKATELKASAQPKWLAKQRVMRSAVNLLVGDEGIGKSLFWVWIVAAVTTGQALPGFGIPAREPGNVTLAAITEDPWAQTVRPRLEVAGADLDRIEVICVEDDGSGAPMFPGNMFLIREEAELKPDLIVVDAWLDVVPPDLKVKDPHDARRALAPWREIAIETGAAVMLLTHTNRVSTFNARDKYGITMELRKKARVTLFAQSDDEGHLIVGPDKMNAAATVPASVFGIAPVQKFSPTEDDDGTIPKLNYIGASDQTAREHIAEAYQKEHNGGSDGDVAWLASFLADGPKWAADVNAAADVLGGLSERRLKTAKRKLRVGSVKDSCGAWFWRLPQHQGSQPQGKGTTGVLVGPLEPLELVDNLTNSTTGKDSQEDQGDQFGGTHPARPTCRQCGEWMAHPDSIARGVCSKTDCLAAEQQRGTSRK